MSSITDALKAKHPEATGDTIAEVISTMDASGGGESGSGSNGVTIIEVTFDADDYPAEGTCQRIDDAFEAGSFVILRFPQSETLAYFIGNGLTEGRNGHTFISFDPMYPSMLTKYHFPSASYGYEMCYRTSINLTVQH